MDPVRLRLLNQQLSSPQFSKPDDVVKHMGAMQAQEYRLMRWAVAMRTKNPSENTFKKAFDSGSIIRLHLLRGTWQLVSGDDYWWMLDLCGSRARSVIKGWMSSNKISLEDDEILKVRDLIIKTTEKKGSATKEDFDAALKEQGILMDDHRLSYHIRYAELDGILCSGDLLPMKATYALSEIKIPRKPSMNKDEMLRELALRYFQSHQPATLEDFVWWSGMGVNDCRKAITLLSPNLHLERWNGLELFLMDNCRTRGTKKEEFLLLPSYDEYLIGYKSRMVVLDPQFKHYAHNNSGIFQPVIANQGKICGNWSPTKNNLEVTLFQGSYNIEQFEKEWNRYLKFKDKN